MTTYKKPKSVKKAIWFTIKVLLTVAVLAVAGIIVFNGVAYGWDSVTNFFKSSLACLIACVFLVAGAAIVWIISLVGNIKKVSEDE